MAPELFRFEGSTTITGSKLVERSGAHGLRFSRTPQLEAGKNGLSQTVEKACLLANLPDWHEWSGKKRKT